MEKGHGSSLCSEMRWVVEPQRRRVVGRGVQCLDALVGV